jgi:hypothetical protein
MFPDEYPQKSLMVEVKSKSLPERVMKLIENIAEKEAKKLLGQHQVRSSILPYCILKYFQTMENLYEDWGEWMK